MSIKKEKNQITEGVNNSKKLQKNYKLVLNRSKIIKISRVHYALIALILSVIIIACTNTSKLNSRTISELPTQSKVLKIWWDKGFNLEEDEALQQLVKNWEKKSGNKIKLSFYTNDELPKKTQRAIKAGKVPDIVMSSSAQREITPRLAWEGKLVDVSDIIEPIKSIYSNGALEDVTFYNNVEKKRAYYALPINQLTIHIFYWRDLLKQAGFRESDIPKDWNGFWEFWKQMQDKLRTQQKQDIYGLGFPQSLGAADTYYLFEQILEANDVELVNSNGQLLLDNPQVRQGIVNSLEWYTKFYKQGYVPRNAVNWLNPDNNRSLLNRAVLMTPNTTLSIPGAVRQDPDTYRNKLGTIEFPNKPSGKPMRHLVTYNAAVLFADSPNQKIAKDFLGYLAQPKTIASYLKASGTRYLPVMTPVWQDPFWTDPADPHRSTAAKTLIHGQTRPFSIVQNPAYSLVLEQNVWGKAINRIAVNGITPKQAADEAIEQIKQIFAQWQ
ncbi:ABC transporter substrate-binding protein [Aetokthonos hydrillicola Thurmond2011]|jgi:multiple sugar transport system substrate-binding protein|uniref:ABC transporter substrate-binding protein n=1 Tax=Aetokthonos hydrillicola Thurmond2011 TaxID=2712845 RepID=A0AAP5IFZ4_9CYAN|nr:ABC transporter substrate-binding protein [Aetokthonos hydrillicola]MBO3463662.1 carbohydrate ABC transporter substrate-binding protein [Aetokthonos hydrillicola CCALA 1050]MBW4590018.1 ABC transporter substrate-binding protein [Aetokthonos hydrillicola CCALA 1050]MDR9900599.1 ABC transporter substrate-binding protein [Aetokthonos hydrillicola Thurmond2011]